MLYNYGAVLIFIIISFLFLVSLLIMNFFLAPKKKEKNKEEIFECGEPTIGDTPTKFNSHFFNIALVYILFDVEVALLIPVILVYQSTFDSNFPHWNFIIIGIFILQLIIGLIYEWHEGNLDWVKKITQEK